MARRRKNLFIQKVLKKGRGKFHNYCVRQGFGKANNACIQKGLRSHNKLIRKRANFARTLQRIRPR